VSTTERPVPAPGAGASTEDPYLVVERSPKFRDLRGRYRRFVFPMGAAFLIWYFLLMYAAGRSIGGVQNGIAISGDYMSAASFLGITGLIALYGYDGFLYSVGFLVAYLVVLLFVA
jgi:uncharacterized membrane protein (DUF485 family)